MGCVKTSLLEMNVREFPILDRLLYIVLQLGLVQRQTAEYHIQICMRSHARLQVHMQSVVFHSSTFHDVQTVHVNELSDRSLLDRLQDISLQDDRTSSTMFDYEHQTFLELRHVLI
jgi:hypothetical protein